MVAKFLTPPDLPFGKGEEEEKDLTPNPSP